MLAPGHQHSLRRLAGAFATVAVGALACGPTAKEPLPTSGDASAPAEVGFSQAAPAPAAPPRAATVANRAVTGSAAATEEARADAGSEAEVTAALARQLAGGAPAMLVRTGHASIEVDSLEVAIMHVRATAQRVGGYVAGTQMQDGEHQRRAASVELRVPSARFDDVVAGLAPLGEVEDLTITTQDVGEEYTDIQARVANARRLEDRLVEVLATRTGKLADVLQVERELARVREEIERMEGRMRFLGARASMSTLTLALHEPLPVLAHHPNSSRIADAFRQAWDNFVGVVAGLIASLGVLVPLGMAAGLVWLGWRKWGRHVKPAT